MKLPVRKRTVSRRRPREALGPPAIAPEAPGHGEDDEGNSDEGGEHVGPTPLGEEEVGLVPVHADLIAGEDVDGVHDVESVLVRGADDHVERVVQILAPDRNVDQVVEVRLAPRFPVLIEDRDPGGGDGDVLPVRPRATRCGRP